MTERLDERRALIEKRILPKLDEPDPLLPRTGSEPSGPHTFRQSSGTRRTGGKAPR
jgi:hypothetical protein